MIQASEDKKNRLIGFAMLTNLGVGCISRAVSFDGRKILRFEGRTNRQTPWSETILIQEDIVNVIWFLGVNSDSK